MARASVIVAIAILLCRHAFAQEPPFTVTRPDPGDTLVLSSYGGANEIYIDWTVAPGTEDQPVLITLQRGEDVASLETIEAVNGSAPNNGSYTWDGRDSISLESGEDPWLARTACNYTVRLSVDGLVAYSQYFTIINEDDGPVPDSALCPIERGVTRPQLAEDDSTVLEIDGSAGSGSSGDSTGSGGGGGINSGTLAVAIVVPIVVLLLIFALLLWFGIRRGWFVKLSNRRNRDSNLTHENTAGFEQGYSQPMSPLAEKKEASSPDYGGPPRELHADYRPWEAEVREVHQLEGDERDARIAGAHMRGT